MTSKERKVVLLLNDQGGGGSPNRGRTYFPNDKGADGRAATDCDA